MTWSATNGLEALELLDKESFDGVLMDIQMPVMDGYTASRKIREQEKFKDLPVIAMTANAMAGDREQSICAGMNDHIAKPVNVNQMFNIMAKWITSSNPLPEEELQRPQITANDPDEIPHTPGITAVVMNNFPQDNAVLATTSGEKALQLAAREPQSDVILMDVEMPGIAVMRPAVD